jgi:GntR family transcriptional repressor for pyruvate dehydrogenase complex
MLEPIKKTRLYEEVIEQILRQIKSGTLSPGDRLPTERELAEKLNVSRTSIREALRSMEMMGYIESRVGISGGTFIKQVTIEDVIGPLTKLLNTYKKAESVFAFVEARIILESSAAKLAARRRNEQDLKSMEEALLVMAGEIEKGDLGLKGDQGFHMAIVRSTHNDVLIKIDNMLEELLADSRRATLVLPGIPREALDDHRKILKAITSKSEKESVSLMKMHLRKAYDKLPYAGIDFD